MVDFNERLLKEIAHLRYLKEKLGIVNERTVHFLELFRFIRNDELGIAFDEGLERENEW
ncbi:hypothetical protein P4571_07950 [Niallia alba]|uniref:hypothetical protein n=1 Tax=Niallia alba TaxID=2729105 RepID=UPI002E1DD739|nr:hypothetical protein [Niallia alba]